MKNMQRSLKKKKKKTVIDKITQTYFAACVTILFSHLHKKKPRQKRFHRVINGITSSNTTREIVNKVAFCSAI